MRRLMTFIAAHQRGVQIASAAAAALFLYLLRGKHAAAAIGDPERRPTPGVDGAGGGGGDDDGVTLGLDGWAIDGAGQDAEIHVPDVSEPGDWDF